MIHWSSVNNVTSMSWWWVSARSRSSLCAKSTRSWTRCPWSPCWPISMNCETTRWRYSPSISTDVCHYTGRIRGKGDAVIHVGISDIGCISNTSHSSNLNIVQKLYPLCPNERQQTVWWRFNYNAQPSTERKIKNTLFRQRATNKESPSMTNYETPPVMLRKHETKF